MSDPNTIPKVDRYPGLWPYRQEQSDIFFGRNREKEELFFQVRKSQVVIVFANSGVGKSSLLNAGTVPLLRANGYFPINILFTQTRGADSGTPLQIFKKAFDPFTGINKSPFGEMPNHVWECVKSSQFPNKATPVIILDQFEELFNYPKEQVNDFIMELSELIHDLAPSRVNDQLLKIERKDRTDEQYAWASQPPMKFIFAIRSDHLSDLQKVDKVIPGLLSKRFQLLPMNDSNAEEAICKPALVDDPGRFDSSIFTFSKDALGRIVKSLKDETTGEIATYQLQIICRYIEDLVKNSYTDTAKPNISEITTTVFDANSETKTVLRNYYENQVAGIGTPEEQKLTRKLLENNLMEKNVRVRLPQGRVMDILEGNDLLLQKLLVARLVKKETDAYGSEYYEISHDSLKEPILKSKLESLEKDRLSKERDSKLTEAKQMVAMHYESMEIKDYQKALDLLKSAEAIYSTLGETASVIETGLLISKALEEKGIFSDARDKLTRMLADPQIKDNRKLIGIVTESLGTVYLKWGRVERAREMFIDALTCYNETKDHPRIARLSEHLGIVSEATYRTNKPSEKGNVKRLLQEADFYFKNAFDSFIFVKDLFGYERVKYSLQRIKKYLDELEKPDEIAKPWGYFTEMFTGTVHELKGPNTVRIGRNVYNEESKTYTLKNEIGFPGRYGYMSRRHASITPDLILEDTQSMNGTTINTLPLYYGTPRYLQDSDIVVLANIMPMEFNIAKPVKLKIPDDCWGLIIEGNTRQYFYLSKPDLEYSIPLDYIESNDITRPFIQEGANERSVIRFSLRGNIPSFLAENVMTVYHKQDPNGPGEDIMANWRIRTTAKDPDRFYKDYILSTGDWFKILDFPFQPELVSVNQQDGQETILAYGPTFQLIMKPEVNPDLKDYWDRTM
ncbi:MAG: hypothetical protein C5B52_15305 [Bacteroidetes bacterium]|nr:MAG: hypothetical protein C5B52_15305 [Bacteroidota bacterium]